MEAGTAPHFAGPRSFVVGVGLDDMEKRDCGGVGKWLASRRPMLGTTGACQLPTGARGGTYFVVT